MELGLLLRMAAEGTPERVAVGPRDSGWTYAQLLEHAERTAGWLQSRGAERIALLDVNSQVVPALVFGAAMAGIPFAPLNYRLADDRLEAIVRRLAPAVLVVEDGATGRIHVPGVDVVSRSQFLQEVAAAQATGSADTDPESVAILLFTSGTSGEPKSAILRHRHLVSYVLSTVEFMGADDTDAALVSVPPYHIAGMSAVMTSVYGGRRIVYLPAFDPKAWVAHVRSERISHAMVVPTMLARILDELEADGGGLPSLRHLAYGGGRMPLPVIEHALAVLPDVAFVNAYGLTETSSTVAILGPEDHRAAFGAADPKVARRLASVGRPLPSIELVVRDEDGAVLPAETPGQIWVRGEQVSGEYADRGDDATSGWFETKDVGWLDEEGFLFLEGRADDVIVRGGENLSPGEIEDVLLAHPDVAEAAVVGVPSTEWGQVPVAVVVAGPERAPAPGELADWVRKHLRSSRVPDRVVLVDALPYTDTGKLQRRRVRDKLLQEIATA